MNAKLERLSKTLRPLLLEGLVIAFSGGVDSSFLLWMSSQLSKEMEASGETPKLLALTTTSASMPSWELEEATAFANGLSVEHLVTQSHEVEQQAYARNDGTRCYYCKTELFRLSWGEANARGFKHVAYGYNTSDRGDVRPGHQAAQEMKIHSPLAEADLSKDDIRQALREYHLEIADKPASPCLASRIMVGVEVTPQKLKDIEEMESLLRGAGLQVFRVRLHEEGPKKFLRIEVASEEMDAAFKIRRELADVGKNRGYAWVTLDLGGYRTGGGT